MRYLRKFQLDGESSPSNEWLVSPEEEVGCSIKVVRGRDDDTVETAILSERVAVVCSGSVSLTTSEGTTKAAKGDAIFIPAHTKAAINGSIGSTWVEIQATDTIDSYERGGEISPKVIPINDDNFVNYKNSGFWFYPMIDRASMGSESIRLNTLKMENKVGSPDWHIHAFAQMYLIQEGEMTIDIGRARYVAGPNTLVLLPAGVVHRNFNNSGHIEKHVALLVPEPDKNEIFDYAVTIHEYEAEMMKDIPEQ